MQIAGTKATPMLSRTVREQIADRHACEVAYDHRGNDPRRHQSPAGPVSLGVEALGKALAQPVHQAVTSCRYQGLGERHHEKCINEIFGEGLTIDRAVEPRAADRGRDRYP
jgi:hypothetical protein